MNIKTTLILVLLLLIVGGVFLVIDMRHEGDGPPPPNAGDDRRAGELVFGDGVQATEIRRIIITRDGKTVEMAKEGDDWYQVAPVRFKLQDTSGPGNLAAAVEELRFVERFTPGTQGRPSLKAVGLDPAYATVTVSATSADSAEASSHTIQLSSRPVGGTGYARIDDRPEVYVVRDRLHNAALARTVNDWRQRQLPAPDAAQASHVNLTHAGTQVGLYKIDGRWFLDPDQTQRADTEAVAGMLDAIRSIYIMGFAEDAPHSLAPYGLEQPETTVTITTPGIDGRPHETVTLNVGGAADLKNESRYANWSSTAGDQAQGGDVIFSIPANATAALRVTADSLRDPRMVTARKNDITELLIDRDGMDTIDLQLDGINLVFGEPKPAFEPDRETWRDLLEQIAEAEAIGYEPEVAPHAERLATIEIKTLANIDIPESVTIYAGPDDAHVIALREGESTGYRIKRSDLAMIFEPVLSLRDRTLLKLDPSAVRSIAVRRPDAALGFVRRENDQNTWASTDGVDLEEPAIDALLNEMILLQADRWLDEPLEAEDAAKDSVIELTIETDDGTRRVLKAEPTSGRATLSGVDKPFVIPRRLADTLAAEFRDRTVLPLSADQIDRVKITDGGQTFDVARGTGGAYTSPGGNVDQKAAAALFDTLAGLRVVRYYRETPRGLETDQPSRVLTIETEPSAISLYLWAPTTGTTSVAVGRLTDGDYFELSNEDGAKLNAVLTPGGQKKP